MRRPTVGWLVVCLAGLPATLETGCTRQAGTPASAAPTPAPVVPIVKTAERGPIRLTVTADKNRISIAERLKLTIEAEADAGWDVEMPQFGVQMQEFQIRDFREKPRQELSGGRRRQVQEYDLDIFLSGQYTVPAVTVRYRPRGAAAASQPATSAPAAGNASEGELSTESFTVEVTSLLEGAFDPQKFRDVKAAAELPRVRDWPWLRPAAAAGGGLILLAAGLWYWRRRRRRTRRAPVIPADQWALERLRNLVAAGLIEEGRVREFHYHLSEIVRRYIELRFGLMAPERTTEEFLEELRTSPGLPAAHRPGLRAFLEACDLVKYARYEPGGEEIERVFNAARDFVLATRGSAAPATEAAA